MNVLQNIIQNKKNEIPKKLPKANIAKTQKNVIMSFRNPVTSVSKLKLIAELKRVSPSKGVLNREISVESAVRLYEPYASALSILTEKNYFGGSLEDLREASRLTNLPLLRKDFITESIQVAESRLYGADFYLLIAAALEKNQLSELIEAGREYNMPALIEVHNEEELESVLDLNVSLLGINNRNLTDLSIDLNTTGKLIERIPAEMKKNIILVSESGLKTMDDLQKVENMVNAVLMGTIFMESNEPESLLKKMFGK